MSKKNKIKTANTIKPQARKVIANFNAIEKLNALTSLKRKKSAENSSKEKKRL